MAFFFSEVSSVRLCNVPLCNAKYRSYSVIRRTVFFKKFLISTKNYRQSLGASYRRIFSRNNFFFITVTGTISSK